MKEGGGQLIIDDFFRLCYVIYGRPLNQNQTLPQKNPLCFVQEAHFNI